jgi:nucleoside-diphosphate-sugar epimerase
VVDEGDALDRLLLAGADRERSASQQRTGELEPEEARPAGDDGPHALLRLGARIAISQSSRLAAPCVNPEAAGVARSPHRRRPPVDIVALVSGFQRATFGELPFADRERRPGRRRTLVTGGTGFIGSYLCRALADSGREVCAFDVREFAPEGRFVLGEGVEAIRFERGSIDDRARVFDVVGAFEPDEIVHMAMVIDPAYLVVNRSSGFRINVEGTIHVLEATRLFGVERLVNYSSIGVLPRVQYEPIDAAHPLLLPDSGPGTDFYGAAKVASEAFCFAYHQALGVDFRTIRPSAVYGLGMNSFPGPIKGMVEGAVRGERVRFATGGAHPRSYTHAADVAGLTLAVLAAPAGADRIFYGANGEPLATTTEVAELVREVVPGADVEIGEELAEAEKAVVAFRGRLSIDNARSQLGWEPAYASLRDGIRRYADDYRAFLRAQAAP